MVGVRRGLGVARIPAAIQKATRSPNSGLGQVFVAGSAPAKTRGGFAHVYVERLRSGWPDFTRPPEGLRARIIAAHCAKLPCF